MLSALTEIASALSDPSRVRLLNAVIDPPCSPREVCVCNLTDLLDLAPSTVSKHLSILRQAGLIEGRKDGRWMYYRAAGEESSRPVADAIEWVRLARSRDKRLIEDAARLRTIMDRNSETTCCLAEQPPAPSERLASARRPRVLFLCTGNSCRSQMAEGWARHLRSSVIDAYSAGTRPQALNPLAVRVMREAGVDIARQTSKRPEDIGVEFDAVVAVCDSAREACPVLPGAPRVIHVGFEDPPRLAENAKSEEEALRHYRRVRDEIRVFVETLPDSLALRASSKQSTASKGAIT